MCTHHTVSSIQLIVFFETHESIDRESGDLERDCPITHLPDMGAFHSFHLTQVDTSVVLLDIRRMTKLRRRFDKQYEVD